MGDMFHFLRAEYLLLLFPVWLLVFWLLRRQDDANLYRGMVDEAFLPYLLQKQHSGILKAPVLLGIVLSLMVLALSGPAYKLSKSAGKKATSEVAFVLNVSDAMQSGDLMPSRLKRAVLKLEDFLSKNSDIKAALVAYYGSAHLVMPLIRDKSIIARFAGALSPEIMPRKGDALYEALKLARRQFVKVDGTIVVLSDRLSKSEVKKIEQDAAFKPYKIVFYNITSASLQKADTQRLSQEMGAEFIPFSVDDSDIDALQRAIRQQYENAQKEGSYVDSGYAVLMLIVPLLLLFFRKGFLTELWSVK